MKDVSLTRRLLDGDSEALCEVYHLYKDDLLSVAMALLGNGYAAEDCVHDVFVQFADAARTIHIQQNLRGYLMRCVANRAKNMIKRKQVQASMPRQEIQTTDPMESPAGRLIITERAQLVCAALGRLPEAQREVITLHLHGQLSFREIAEALHHSINTIQSRYRYGIEKLRTIL